MFQHNNIISWLFCGEILPLSFSPPTFFPLLVFTLSFAIRFPKPTLKTQVRLLASENKEYQFWSSVVSSLTKQGRFKPHQHVKGDTKAYKAGFAGFWKLLAVSFKLTTEQDDTCEELRVVVQCKCQPCKTGVCKKWNVLNTSGAHRNQYSALRRWEASTAISYLFLYP